MSDFSKAFGSFGSFAGSIANSGLTSAADSFLSGLSNSIFGGITAKRDWKYKQKEMALQQDYNLQNMQKQYDYQLDFWNKQNQYNDPSNAVARWRTAGVSPMAVFGSSPGGAGVAGGSVSVPNSENPNASGVNQRGLPMMTLAEASQMRNQQKLADADVDLKAALAEYYRGNTRDPEETKRGQSLENSLLEQRVIGEELANRIKKNDADFSDYALGNRKQLSDAEVKRAIETNNKIIADTALSVSQKELNEQSARESVARILQIEAQTALLANQNKWYGKLTQAQIDSIMQGIDESVNRMSLNDSQKFLNAAKEWNTMADTKGKDLDNWRKEFYKELEKALYSDGDSDTPNVLGEMIYGLFSGVKGFSPFK